LTTSLFLKRRRTKRGTERNVLREKKKGRCVIRAFQTLEEKEVAVPNIKVE